MAVDLNHTIVHARDKRESAAFLSEILDLPAPVPFGPFLGVNTHNGVTYTKPFTYTAYTYCGSRMPECAHRVARMAVLPQTRHQGRCSP